MNKKEKKKCKVKKTQICRICNKELSLSKFQFRKDNNKYRTECKQCKSLIDKNYYNKNKKTILERNKIYYSQNKEQRLIYQSIHGFEWKNQIRFGGNREIILQRDNYKCTNCESMKDLCVHHIDGTGFGYSRENKNNSLDNLITLCRKCHTSLHKKGEYYEQNRKNKKEI